MISATPVPMTLQEGQSISEQATNFVVKIMSPFLGYVDTSKVQKLLAEVLEAIKYHGCLSTGHTSSTEAAYKDNKPFYTQTSINMETLTQQLEGQAQGAREIGRKNAAACAEARRTLKVELSLSVRTATAAAAAAAASVGHCTPHLGPTLARRAATAAVAAGAATAPAAAASAASTAAASTPAVSASATAAADAAGAVTAPAAASTAAAAGAAAVSAAATVSLLIGATITVPVRATATVSASAEAGDGTSVAARAAGAVTGHSRKLARKRSVYNVPKLTMCELLRRLSMVATGQLLDLPPQGRVPVWATVDIVATFDSGARSKELLRAAPKFKTGMLWYDAILFTLDEENAARGGVSEGTPDASDEESGSNAYAAAVRAIICCVDIEYAVI